MPAGPIRSPAKHPLAASPLIDRINTDSPVAAHVELKVQVETADTAAVAIRHPCEAHPRSPKRATATGRGGRSPAAMVAALGRVVHNRHVLVAGTATNSEYVTYAPREPACLRLDVRRGSLAGREVTN